MRKILYRILFLILDYITKILYYFMLDTGIIGRKCSYFVIEDEIFATLLFHKPCTRYLSVARTPLFLGSSELNFKPVFSPLAKITLVSIKLCIFLIFKKFQIINSNYYTFTFTKRALLLLRSSLHQHSLY